MNLYKFIEYRESVTFDSLMRAIRQEGFDSVLWCQDEVWEELQGLISSGRIERVKGKFAGVYYRIPRDEAKETSEALVEEAEKIFPHLESVNGEGALFTASAVWKTLGKEFGLSSPNRPKELLQYLVSIGKLRVAFTKNSPGGPSPQYEVVRRKKLKKNL